MRARRTAVVAAALLVGLTAGCAGHGGTAPKAAPSGSASSAAPSGSPSGYADMQKKVDAAESAVAAADRDAASDDDR
ncbi:MULTISPECIES: hypothetical protein [unclassified Streptomyces]|uniref:hypothetical protein n=1 Tax=unclassified Streptomyces TaxID=2593676 RepID=UPI002740C9BB|nr:MULTISPECIES: hypothetical protein [unclassified Streptomyces]